MRTSSRLDPARLAPAARSRRPARLRSRDAARSASIGAPSVRAAERAALPKFLDRDRFDGRRYLHLERSGLQFRVELDLRESQPQVEASLFAAHEADGAGQIAFEPA